GSVTRSDKGFLPHQRAVGSRILCGVKVVVVTIVGASGDDYIVTRIRDDGRRRIRIVRWSIVSLLPEQRAIEGSVFGCIKVWKELPDFGRASDQHVAAAVQRNGSSDVNPIGWTVVTLFPKQRSVSRCILRSVIIVVVRIGGTARDDDVAIAVHRQTIGNVILVCGPVVSVGPQRNSCG